VDLYIHSPICLHGVVLALPLEPTIKVLGQNYGLFEVNYYLGYVSCLFNEPFRLS
jgi:hypothetical protein